MALAKDRSVGTGEKRRLRSSGYRVADSEPKEPEEIKVPAYVPEKLREDWIKHRKQINEYARKGPK
jgi:hypothetical protein